jgi:hypothetical protein
MKRLDTVVRAISAAGKSMRLYPPSSALPRQNVETAVAAIEDYFTTGNAVIALAVTRSGFASGGEQLTGSVGASDLVDQLRDHAVAELAITPGCSADELLTFLTTIDRSPDELRLEGGLGVALTGAGVDTIRVSDVQLTVVDTAASSVEEDLDEFLRALASDPERLTSWFAVASAGDPKTFEEGLMELVRVSGPSGYDELLHSLSSAFCAQSPDGKDALLRLAMDAGPSRDLTGGVFCYVGSTEIAGSVLGGDFGRNMLSLSSALTRLPLDQVTAQVRAEVQAMLPNTGHTSSEADFLGHMLEVRERTLPEPALVDADRTYRAVAEAASITDEVIEKARGAVTGSATILSAASVRTLLTLLDQQSDFDLYCDTANSLAALVPKLIEQGDFATASRVFTELSHRESMADSPWPDLSSRMSEALALAGGPRSMAALIKAVVANPELAASARALVRYASEDGAPALVTEAVSLKGEGLRVAGQLLGRRIIDQLNRIAPQLQWFQLAPVAELLAKENDGHSALTLDTLMRRPDEQSRREVLAGVAAARGPISLRIIEGALRDASPEVAIHAARFLSKSGEPTATPLLIKRLGELDLDNNDFALGREIISALTRLPDPDVDKELARVAGRRALIKRGHYGEIQDLVRQAQAFRAKGGADQ